MKNLVYGVLSITVGVIVILCISVAAAGCVSENIPSISERAEIVSLDREVMIDGHFSGGFFLGSGYIESVPSYFYYIKLSNGGYKLKTVPTEDCVIFMDENTSPYLKAIYIGGYISPSSGEYGDVGSEYIRRKYDSFLYDADNIQVRYANYYRSGDVELHIPANSIIKEYKP
jgi:hypothetical protein